MRRTTSSSARATRSTSGSCRDSCRSCTTTGTSTRTCTPGCTASAARRSRPKPISSTASAPSTTRCRSGSRSATGSSGCRRSRQQLLELYERADFVLPGFRANEARSFIEGGLQDFSISRAGQTWGIPIPWDPDSVAYVWADALVNYLSALTYARPGEDLRRDVLAVGQAPAREGHPALPLRLLAGDAARRGVRAAAAAVRARVPAARRQEDLEVARERRRPARPARRLRHRPGPVLVRAGRLVRPGRRGLDRRASTSATSASSATTSATCSRGRRRWSRATATARFAPLPSPDGAVAAALAPLGDDVAARLDAFDITGALERIWEVVRALNREVETTAPWQLAKDEARADELDRVLYDLVDGLRAVAVALSAYIPETAAAILSALQQPAARRLVARRVRPHGRDARDRGRSAALPAPRAARGVAGSRVIDTHAHLDGCDEPAAFLVERARAVGVSRIVTIGTGIESCRAALAIAEAEQGVFAALGIDPHQAGGAEASPASTSSSSCSSTRAPSRSARRASTTSTTSRRGRSSASSSSASSSSRRRRACRS